MISGNIEVFLSFFQMLRIHFNKYALDLSCVSDTHIIDNEYIIGKGEKHITSLYIHVFKADNTIHTRNTEKSHLQSHT